MNEVVEQEKKNRPVLDFFTKTLNGTAFGLFATLIVGTIFGAFSIFFSYGAEGSAFCKFMANVFSSKTGLAFVLQTITGAGIGVGVALSLKFDPLKTIVLAAVGETAAFFSLSTDFVLNPTSSEYFYGSFQIGDPLTIYLVCIATALLINLIFKKKTPVDFVLIPLTGAFIGLVLSMLVRYPAVYVIYAIRWVIEKGTEAEPFSMGMIVSVLMGMALTAPISSAAIGFAIFSSVVPGEMTGLYIASGAAIVGCSTQMIGFAIQSRKDNPLGLVISVGLGTSMLQFKNIIRKPIIWLPTIIASAILGPISTCLLKLGCSSANSGMGTAGLVGQIGTISTMGVTSWQAWVGIFGLQIILPAVLVFFIDLLFRKFGLIKEGDLKI